MKHLLLYTAVLLLGFSASAQEEVSTIYYSKKYLDINIKSQTKLNERVAKQQKKVLEKLKKKEGKLAKRLKRKDSTGYSKYSQNTLTYDSISKIQQPIKARYTVNRSIDSLKGVKKFLEDKAHVTGDGPSITDGYDGQLAGLKNTTTHNQDINKLIGQRTSYLKGIQGDGSKKVKGIKSISKQSFYSNQKIQAYKEMADEPSRAEQKVLEYLQGKEGFDQAMSYTDGNSLQNMNGKSMDDLEKMGFQTKRQMQANLQKKLGGNLEPLQQNMGGQIKEYQDKLSEAKKLKQTAKETKSTIVQAKHIDKPDFRVNPMRGLPLSKRIEYHYNWQTTRATYDGKPAVFSMSAMAGFKHTTRLSYGAGIATSIGLGTNWNNIRFTFEGVGLRTYTAWQWQYGIGAYAGYERMYKQAVFVTPSETTPVLTETPHNKNNYSEAILIGLTKAYRINDKMNGSIHVLYDIWWKEKGLRSPVVLRFATIKN